MARDMFETIYLEGVEKLQRDLQRLADSLPPNEVEPVLRKGATVITKEVKRNITGQFKRRTGNLVRSAKTKKLRAYPNEPAPYISAIDRKVAPHAHLHEFGTVKMPARPFFRPGVDAKREEVLTEVERGLLARLDGVLKR
ncbi:MAG: HK97 gp10 family phage protein [Clostridia bacterium]|nr:HK97 gp10 family phage protein [Clostridia bacterium]